MPLARVDRFGFAGLNVDVQPGMLQPGEWTKLENIDIESGDIRSCWGDSLITQNPPVVPRYTTVFTGLQDTYLVISDGTEVWAFNGSMWMDISPSETPVTNIAWEDETRIWLGVTSVAWSDMQTGGFPVEVSGDVFFAAFLGTLVVSSRGGVPCYWPDESTRMTPLPGWPGHWRGAPVVAYLNHLVALNLDDQTVEGPRFRVAWSDAAAEGEVPQEWQTTAENLAGSVQLRDTDGFLVNAAPLRDDLIIYKNDSIYRMFPRNDEFIFGFERVISDHGCDSPWGFCNIGDAHYFADRGDLRIFNGQVTESIAALKIRESLSEAISNQSRDRSILLSYPEREQIWVGIVPAGQDVVTKVLIFDLLHKSWTVKNYTSVLSMTIGPFGLTENITSIPWESADFPWIAATDSWIQGVFTPTEDGVILGKSARIVRADKSNTNEFGEPKYCYAERKGFIVQGLDTAMTVQAIYPEIIGSAEVEISIGATWEYGGRIRWSPWKKFQPGTDHRVRCRVTGVPSAFRIRSESNASWRLGALSFLAVPAAQRGRS